MFAMRFLDAVTGHDRRARALIDRLIPYLVSDGPTPVTGGAEGEVLHVLDFTPYADAPSRTSFTKDAIAADLVRLARRQQPDGGWTVAYTVYSPPPCSSGVVTRRFRPSPRCKALPCDRQPAAHACRAPSVADRPQCLWS